MPGNTRLKIAPQKTLGCNPGREINCEICNVVSKAFLSLYDISLTRHHVEVSVALRSQIIFASIRNQLKQNINIS